MSAKLSIKLFTIGCNKLSILPAFTVKYSGCYWTRIGTYKQKKYTFFRNETAAFRRFRLKILIMFVLKYHMH